MDSINYIGILIAGIVSMMIGGMWYGPLFGKIWVKEAGITDEMMASAKAKGMTKSYIFTLISCLISAYILAYFMGVQSVTSVSSTLTLVFMIWLGFQIPIHLGTVLWDMKTFKLFVINSLYSLVSLLASGIILSLIG